MSFLDKEKFDQLTRGAIERSGKTPPPSQKKDASALGGKPFLPFGKFAVRTIKDPSWNIFKKTQIKEAKRKDLINKFYLKEIMGTNIDSKEIKIGRQELEKGRTSRFSQYRNLSLTERKEIKKIIDTFPESKS